MKSLLNFVSTLLVWWKRQTISTRIVTYFYGNLIGEDSHGNQYYVSKDKKRRWVIYSDENYASELSIEWHGWVHWTTDKIPIKSKYRGSSQGKVHVHDDANFRKNIKIETPNPKGYEAWEPE